MSESASIIYFQGYQILKNGETYGSMIPVDVTDLQIHDVNLGDQLILQPIALKISQNDTSSEKDDQYEDSENMENLKTGDKNGFK